MDGAISTNLRVFSGGDPAAGFPADPHRLANHELIRPGTGGRDARGIEPFSPAWFDEVEQKRYARHGQWLAAALEFSRHPGESVLILGPGMGSDAVRFLRHGCEVTVGLSDADHADLVRANLDRRGLKARFAPLPGGSLPFADGAFDIAVLNGLYHAPDLPPLADELFRVLKSNGKVIGLFPAKFDAGYWQDVLLPLQHLYWRRPEDPTTAPKTTARELRGVFSRFADHRLTKRHLRRSELPHLWRVLPLGLLERFIGRVLVLKAFKPISARTGQFTPLSEPPAAA
jgi:SAM-dependent methyltransferase